MVEGYWSVSESRLLNESQKLTVLEKLANRINKEGFIQIKSQVHRSQLANKEEVVKKFDQLIKKTLEKKKMRIASKPSKAANERRIVSKKKDGEKKALRERVSY